MKNIENWCIGAVLAGTLTILRYEGVAETTVGLNLIAALIDCGFHYDFDILSCPCQCDKTKFPCKDWSYDRETIWL